MEKIKILAFTGSPQQKSLNKELIKVAINHLQQQNIEVTFLDLLKYPLPIYSPDLEKAEGYHPNAMKIKDILREHHGFIISSPEYNGSVTGLLKNAIDWLSIPTGGNVFKNKVAVLLSTSPGSLGGIRGLYHLRVILENLKVTTLSEKLCVPYSHKNIVEGKLVDEKLNTKLEEILTKFTYFTKSLTKV